MRLRYTLMQYIQHIVSFSKEEPEHVRESVEAILKLFNDMEQQNSQLKQELLELKTHPHTEIKEHDEMRYLQERVGDLELEMDKLGPLLNMLSALRG